MITDYKLNESINDALLVTSATQRETKAGKPFLSLIFTDGKNSITGNYWDWSSGKIPEVNSVVDVTARVTEWQGNKQLNVSSLRQNTTLSTSDFIPESSNDISTIYKSAYALASDITDDFLRAITLSLLEKYVDDWLVIPGAIKIHHNYKGGTLVHSYHVAKLAKAMACCMPKSDRSLVVAGALLHDIGKLKTYTFNGAVIDKTMEGKLFDHITLGVDMIKQAAEEILMPNDTGSHMKLKLLLHIVLAHHGELEYGSPVYPMMLEAHIVHEADSMDAMYEQLTSMHNEALWTDKIWTMHNVQHLDPGFVDNVMSYRDFTDTLLPSEVDILNDTI